MELGEKLLRARQEAGLSQRQLCGEEITRNMLSQIEHGTAKPSMKTLRYLAARLGKPMSYFLDEDMPQLPDHRLPEGVSLLAAAVEAIAAEKYPYAAQLLERAEDAIREYPDLNRRRLLLLGQLPGANLPQLCAALPCLDEELLLRAEAAMAQQAWDRAAALLEAAENRDDPKWNLLRGTLLLQTGDFSQSLPFLQKAEAAFPRETAALLEVVFRELGDFQQAYLYACRQR